MICALVPQLDAEGGAVFDSLFAVHCGNLSVYAHDLSRFSWSEEHPK